MLSEEQVAAFKRDGYVNGGAALDDDEVETLRAELARVIEDDGKDDVKQPVLLRNLSKDEDHPVWQIVNIWEASEAFGKLIRHEKIVEEIAQLTGADKLKVWHDQIQYKPAETGGVNMWHQDAPLWPIILPMTEVSAWVALDDVDEGNGCMSMVPGSHQWGNQMGFIRELDFYEAMPDSFEDNAVEVIRRPVRKGEVHYHHALTWHGSHANTSNRPRRAIAIHYMTHETKFVASGEHVMKPFVEVGDGEVMQGDHFPEVFSKA
ncbi:MAG: phytanoyl-CoA dioxygenase family protein [Gemmatimonadetes bacterium]|nr:phytanoyl-CoA dioxygenase family protein [Gemmatimonadota bacterium]|tara:strand:- start:745 stop:1533 length:789 start_codon:yes stop_codon:yes gene_type:complete